MLKTCIDTYFRSFDSMIHLSRRKFVTNSMFFSMSLQYHHKSFSYKNRFEPIQNKHDDGSSQCPVNQYEYDSALSSHIIIVVINISRESHTPSIQFNQCQKEKLNFWYNLIKPPIKYSQMKLIFCLQLIHLMLTEVSKEQIGRNYK